MPRTGYHRCEGCDCRTKAIEGDAEAFDWPCCEHFPDNKAPCRYGWFALCYSSVEIDSTNCITGTNRWPLFYPVTEFRKSCYVGCTWAMRPTCASQTGGDDYTAALLDVTADAVNPAFPPAHITGGALGYHDGDYRTGLGGCIAPNSCFGDFDPDCVNDLDDTWTLTAAGTAPGDVTMTITHPVLVAWALANGKTLPVYENTAEWVPFGRENPMRITTGHADWPMLPYTGCMFFIDDPGASDNPCDTQDDRCACNDFNFNDSITLILQITGCSGISGLVSVGMARYRSPTSLPCGVSYPSPNPCGVFIGTLSTGSGCSFGGVSWSGGVLLMIWCDGDTYNGKVYCYSNDTSCYVEQLPISITRLDPLCWGVIYLELTLPDIDCCCPELPPCSCAPSGTPTPSLYTDITSTCGASFESSSTVELLPTITGCWEASGAGTGGLPSGIDIVNVCCDGDVWTCTLTFLSAACGSPSSVAASGTCSPFGVTFTFTLDATCCPPGGGTVTVTVME